MMTLLLATVFSIAMIILLWRGDPKRRRVAGLPDSGHSALKRRLMFVALLLPGLLLAVAGDSSGFLIWFGSCAVGGWLITQTGSRDPAR
jgi:hypothetical protein